MLTPAPAEADFPRDGWIVPAIAPLLDEASVARLAALGKGRIFDVVVNDGLLSERELLHAIAARYDMPVADLTSTTEQALELVPERWARRFGVLPLALDDDALVVATANPCDVDAERALAFAAGRPVRFAIASARAIAARLDGAYSADVHPVRGPSADAERAPEIEILSADQTSSDDDPADGGDAISITRLADQILAEGIAARASDIHIETEERAIAVRHRVDGVMRVVRRLPRSLSAALVSRIKIVSGLDIADRLRPQDGRARVAVNGVAVDLRVSTLPASHGEKVVIRVLDARAAVHTLEAIGFAPNELARIERLLQAREGLILVTGPTGSGKTTTLYAALRRLKQRGVNIVTVEDPIEYRIPGIVQVQVRDRAGLTFAAALRSIMRQDPDVVLIGEIRDRETAEIAIQASLTGHLVLSTLHTNDAWSAVTRLIDIGVAPYKIATAVKGVVAQRLLRRVCANCGGIARQGSEPEEGESPSRSRARCETCKGSGLHGRLAIVEVLVTGAEFERGVAEGAPTERIAGAARADGMQSLWQSGLARVAAGETTLDELHRVATPDDAGGGTYGSAAPVMDSRAAVRYLPSRPIAPITNPAERAPVVAELSIGTVDVYVIRPHLEGWRVLVLQRALDSRCPGAWEAVHGRLEAGEEPEDAAIREVREETGFEVERLYNVTVQPFYLHATHTVQVAVVFAAFVALDASLPGIGSEHQRAEWLTVPDALDRFQWPREREALREITHLLRTGDAGPVEDVLRVR